MAQPMVTIVHPLTGGKATCPESTFTGKGGLRDKGWVLEADLKRRPARKKKAQPVEEETDA